MGLREIRERDNISRQDGRQARSSGRNREPRSGPSRVGDGGVRSSIHGQGGNHQHGSSYRRVECPAPAIPDRPQVRAPQASASSTGYAEVYEGTQRRFLSRLHGEDDHSSGSARTPQQQVTADVHTRNGTRNTTPFVSAQSEEQTRRHGAGAEGGAIYDVGITDYSSNAHTQVPEYEKGYQRVDSQGYEIPFSIPSKYMNKEPQIHGENVYEAIIDDELMIQRDKDEDDNYEYETKL